MLCTQTSSTQWIYSGYIVSRLNLYFVAQCKMAYTTANRAIQLSFSNYAMKLDPSRASFFRYCIYIPDLGTKKKYQNYIYSNKVVKEHVASFCIRNVFETNPELIDRYCNYERILG